MTSYLLIKVTWIFIFLHVVILQTMTTSVTQTKQCSVIAVFGLRTADCTAQGFHEIPLNLHSNEEISVLLFDNNLLSLLSSDSFHTYINLQEVHLARNRIGSVERWAFRGLHSLQRIDLASNRLTTISKFFLDDDIRASLRFLSINGNPIQTIDQDAFSSLTKLEELNLEGCWLKEFELNLLNDLKHLTNLNLENNQLRSFRSDLCPSRHSCLPPRLSVLRLARNRWMCDCKLRWFRKWLNVSKVNWDFGRSSPSCSEPEILKDISWRYVSPDQFACASEIHINMSIGTSVYLPYGSNDACSLRCDVTGYPEPTVTWYRHVQRVEETTTMTSSHQAQSDDVIHVTSCVRLLNATQLNAGDYRCVANNSAGRSEFNFKLYVIDPSKQTPITWDDLTLGEGGQVNEPRVGLTRLELILGASGGAIFLAFMLAVFVICLSRRIDCDKRAYKVRDQERREGEEKGSCGQFVDRNNCCDGAEETSRIGDLINDREMDQNIKQLLFLSNGDDNCHRSFVNNKIVGNKQTQSNNCKYYHLNRKKFSQQSTGEGEMTSILQKGVVSSPKRAVMIQFDTQSVSSDKVFEDFNNDREMLSSIVCDQQRFSSEISPAMCPTTSITPDLLNNSVLDVGTNKSGCGIPSHDYNSYGNNDKQLNNHQSPSTADAAVWRCNREAGKAEGSCFDLYLSLKRPRAVSVDQGSYTGTTSTLSETMVNGISRNCLTNLSLQDRKLFQAAKNNKQSAFNEHCEDIVKYDPKNIMNYDPENIMTYDLQELNARHNSSDKSPVIPFFTESISSYDSSLFSVSYSPSNALSSAGHDDDAVALSLTTPSADLPGCVPSIPPSTLPRCTPFVYTTPSVKLTVPSSRSFSPAVRAATAFTADFGSYNTKNMILSEGCFNGSAVMKRSQGKNQTNVSLPRTKSLAPSVSKNSSQCKNETHSDCSKQCSTLATDYRRCLTSQVKNVTSQTNCVTSLNCINTIPLDSRTINRKELGLRHGSSGSRITLPESIAGVTEGLYPRPPPKPARMFQQYEPLESVSEIDSNVAHKLRRHTNPQSWITNC